MLSEVVAHNVSRFTGFGLSQSWDTPEGAHLNCQIASHNFVPGTNIANIVGLTDLDVEVRLVRGLHPELVETHTGLWDDLSLAGHAFCVVDGMAVDFTFRQFDAEAAFPHIEPVEDYLVRWEHDVTSTPVPAPVPAPVTDLELVSS